MKGFDGYAERDGIWTRVRFPATPLFYARRGENARRNVKITKEYKDRIITRIEDLGGGSHRAMVDYEKCDPAFPSWGKAWHLKKIVNDARFFHKRVWGYSCKGSVADSDYEPTQTPQSRTDALKLLERYQAVVREGKLQVILEIPRKWKHPRDAGPGTHPSQAP